MIILSWLYHLIACGGPDQKAKFATHLYHGYILEPPCSGHKFCLCVSLLTESFAPCLLLGSSSSTTAGPPMIQDGNSMLKKGACMLLLATPPSFLNFLKKSNQVYNGISRLRESGNADNELCTMSFAVFPCHCFK